MAKAFAIANAINCILTIALALGIRADAKEYDFSILSLRWPVSYCTFARVKCDEPITKIFTIHGLWPMYLNSGEAIRVDPYDINKDCTTITPAPKDRINKKNLRGIRNDLNRYWADTVHPRVEHINIENWQYQWEKHGMCFDDPDQPSYYFKTALVRAKDLNILDVLAAKEIVPTNDHGYNGEDIEAAIKKSLKVQPTIVCHDYKRTTLLLAEVHICYHKNGTLQSCERRFKHCPGGSRQPIWFLDTKLS